MQVQVCKTETKLWHSEYQSLEEDFGKAISNATEYLPGVLNLQDKQAQEGMSKT